VIVGLTRDGGQSYASKALRTPMGNWLGQISAAVYLIHIPVKDYIVFIIHGSGSVYIYIYIYI